MLVVQAMKQVLLVVHLVLLLLVPHRLVITVLYLQHMPVVIALKLQILLVVHLALLLLLQMRLLVVVEVPMQSMINFWTHQKEKVQSK